MNTRRRVAGFEFQVKRDEEGFSFNVKADPAYQASREEVYRLVDQVVVEARRVGVTVPEILAYLARSTSRKTASEAPTESTVIVE